MGLETWKVKSSPVIVTSACGGLLMVQGTPRARSPGVSLARPALDAIAAGRPAVEAWRSALNEQIRWYQTAADEFFRARASDLGDIVAGRESPSMVAFQFSPLAGSAPRSLWKA